MFYLIFYFWLGCSSNAFHIFVNKVVPNRPLPIQVLPAWNIFRLVLTSENIARVFVESSRPSPLFRLFLFRVADTVPEIRGVIVFGEGRGKGSGRGLPLANPWARRAFSRLKALSFSSGTKGSGELRAIFVSVKKPSPPPPNRQRHLRRYLKRNNTID